MLISRKVVAGMTLGALFLLFAWVTWDVLNVDLAHQLLAAVSIVLGAIAMLGAFLQLTHTSVRR